MCLFCFLLFHILQPYLLNKDLQQAIFAPARKPSLIWNTSQNLIKGWYRQSWKNQSWIALLFEAVLCIPSSLFINQDVIDNHFKRGKILHKITRDERSMNANTWIIHTSITSTNNVFKSTWILHLAPEMVPLKGISEMLNFTVKIDKIKWLPRNHCIILL